MLHHVGRLCQFTGTFQLLNFYVTIISENNSAKFYYLAQRIKYVSVMSYRIMSLHGFQLLRTGNLKRQAKCKTDTNGNEYWPLSKKDGNTLRILERKTLKWFIFQLTIMLYGKEI